jgi:dihydroflavonol-4-reductase
MTTLVTGATGFVGSHVARQLVAAGDTVRVLVRRSSNLAVLEGLPVEPAEGDLRDGASLDRAMQGVCRVYHVAADYRLWTPKPAEIYESNVEGTRRLLEAAQRAGVQRIVYTSTVATIAVPRHGALPNENTQATLDEMIGHYKRSKFLAEQVSLEAARAGVPLVIVNPTAPVGPGDWKPTPTGRIITLKEILDALSAITGRPAPRVRLPHAIALAAGYAAEFYSRLAGREPQIPVEGVKMSRHKMFVESDKAARELGYKPGKVEAALERAVRWYEEHGYLANRAGGKRVAHAAAA